MIRITLPKIQHVFALLALLCFFSSFSIQAAIKCKSYDPASKRDITVTLIGATSSTVGEDIPIGEVIYTMAYTVAAGQIGITCTGTAADTGVTFIQYVKRGKATVTPMGAPTVINGRSVYPTNVPGVGFSIVPFQINVFGSGSHYVPFPYQINSGSYSGQLTTSASNYATQEPVFGIHFIKTGPITDMSQVLGASLPTFEFSVGVTTPASAVFEETFLTVRFAGGVMFNTRTCQIDDVNVEMGKHQLSHFSGSNSVSDWKDFNITMRGCPPFYGYNNIPMSFNYSETTGQVTQTNYIQANELKFTFNSVNGTYDSTTALLENSSDAAQNLGLQMAFGANNSLVNVEGTATYSNPGGLILSTADNATYVIPMKARYYRYSSAAVKPGKANAAVTFTVNYF